MMAEKLALVVPAKMYLLCRALGQITQRSGNNYNWLSYFNRVASGKLKVMFFGGYHCHSVFCLLKVVLVYNYTFKLKLQG